MYVFPGDPGLMLKIFPAGSRGRGELTVLASKIHCTHNAAVQDTPTNEGNEKSSTHPKY